MPSSAKKKKREAARAAEAEEAARIAAAEEAARAGPAAPTIRDPVDEAAARAASDASLVLSLLAIWSPRCLGSAAAGRGHRHVSRFDDDRPKLPARTVTGAAATAASTPFWHHHRHRRTPVVACMNHYTVGGGAAALAGPFWPGRRRSSVHHHGGPPALWALLTAGGVVAIVSTRTAVSRLLASDTEDKDVADGAADNKLGAAMISFIKVYKKELSPLIPPACRFLPTCSEYGVKAIEEFGPAKGAVLTAWRLMRCNPFAGYGLDQPRWPPPGWFAGEKW